MRDFLLGVVFASIMVGAFAGAPVRAQEAPALPTPEYFQFHNSTVVLPPAELSLRAVIDILADYSIVHTSNAMSAFKYYGLTDFRRKQIFINSDVDLADRRDTVLHELFHVLYRLNGIDTSDDASDVAIQHKADEAYAALYGAAAGAPGTRIATPVVEVQATPEENQ